MNQNKGLQVDASGSIQVDASGQAVLKSAEVPTQNQEYQMKSPSRKQWDFSTIFARFAFIFLIYAVITTGYITETLSCQMRHYLTHTHHGRHFFGIVMVFVFIMLEGGWSFDKKSDELSSNDWSTGNCLHSLAIATAIYVVFMISSKSQLIPNLIFFGLVFLLYLANTQRSYWYARNMITEKENKRILDIEKIIFALAVCVLVYGFINYIFYQRRSHGSDFSWKKFILGSSKCASLESH